MHPANYAPISYCINPMKTTLLNWLRINNITWIEINPRSYLNSDNIKFWYMIVKLFSNEALILVCCSSNREWIFFQYFSKFPWLVRSCLFNLTCALSALLLVMLSRWRYVFIQHAMNHSLHGFQPCCCRHIIDYIRAGTKFIF